MCVCDTGIPLSFIKELEVVGEERRGEERRGDATGYKVRRGEQIRSYRVCTTRERERDL